MQSYTHFVQFAGEVKHHNLCKWHGFLDTDFKQTRPSPFSPRYPNGIKNWTAFKWKFEETVPKSSVNSRDGNSQDSHNSQYPDPVLNFGFTGPQYSDKCWLNLRLNCYIFTTGKTHTRRRSTQLSWLSDSYSSGFVWHQLPLVGIIMWLNDVITSPANG